MPITQNLIPSEPQLIDVLNLLKKEIFLTLNCHHIGVIQTFNPTDQTASVTINYKKTFFEFSAQTGLYTSKLVNYPVIAQAPVICLGGGTGALTFPILPGDECLVLFNDRDLDNWFAGGTGTPNATARLHSFSDAVVLVGLRSMTHSLPNYDSTRINLRNGPGGTTLVGVGPSLIKIANATTTLNTLLQSLITQLETLITQIAAITVPITTAPGTSGVPNNAAAIAAVGTTLTTLATQIAALLE